MRNSHLAAKRDVENNEVPRFNETGQFLPTSGMQVILGQPEYHPLFNLDAEETNLEERKAQRSRLILRLEQPVADLRQGVLEEIEQLQREHDVVLQELDQCRDDMVKHESEMRYNGFSLEPFESSQSFSLAIKNRLGAIVVFVLIELIVFGATYYVLEEIMGTMELIVRILINGVVFGSIDFIRRRKDHTWRTSFLLLFLFLYAAMLIGPIATDALQEVGVGSTSSWTLTPAGEEAPSPGFSLQAFLVNYHQYLLFVLWMVLFVIYISFSKAREQVADKEEVDDEESKVWPLIHAGMSNDVKKLERVAARLETKAREVEWQALENLEELHNKLQSLDKEYEELNAEQSRLRTKREILLSNIMAALKGYESHYMQQLEKSPKNLLFQPHWPTKEEIKVYFNITHS